MTGHSIDDTDYSKFREEVRRDYANTTAENAGGTESFAHITRTFADAHAEIAVGTMKLMREGTNTMGDITDGLVMLSISALSNVLNKVTDEEANAIRVMAAEKFLSGLAPDAQLVQAAEVKVN